MAKKAIISTNGNFPAQYNVLQPNADGIYEVVFGLHIVHKNSCHEDRY